MPKLYYVADLVWECTENPVTVSDGKCRVKAPFDGEFLGNRLGPRVTGHIQAAGSGAGTYTEIQIRNETSGRDYFSTGPKFEVDDEDAAGRALLSGGVLGTYQSFKAGEVLALDVNDVPGGADSAEFFVAATCGFWREVY